MPIHEKDDDYIIIETFKKSTLIDLMRFDGNKAIFAKFGIKFNNMDKIADALTKLVASNIQANILSLLEDLKDKEVDDEK